MNTRTSTVIELRLVHYHQQLEFAQQSMAREMARLIVEAYVEVLRPDLWID